MTAEKIGTETENGMKTQILYQYSLLPIVLDLAIGEVCTCNIIISTGMHQRHKYCSNIHWSGRVGIANDLRSGPDGAALM